MTRGVWIFIRGNFRCNKFNTCWNFYSIFEREQASNHWKTFNKIKKEFNIIKHSTPWKRISGEFWQSFSYINLLEKEENKLVVLEARYRGTVATHLLKTNNYFKLPLVFVQKLHQMTIQICGESQVDSYNSPGLCNSGSEFSREIVQWKFIYHKNQQNCWNFKRWQMID